MAPITVVPPHDDSAHGGPVSKSKGLDLESSELGAIQETPESLRKNVTLGQGKWYEAAYHMSTTIATPAAYAALPLAFAGMGWTGSIIALFFGWTVSQYNSYLLCTMNTLGGKKHTRYASIAKEVWGPIGSWIVVFFQQVASIGNNIAVEIAAGLAMKNIYGLYNPNGTTITLQEFIVIFACFQLVLSQLPDIHSLRFFNLMCTVCTIGFTATCLALCIINGNALDRSGVTYEVLNQGTDGLVTYSLLAALGTTSFAFGDTILPEMQATLAEPAVWGMQKAVALSYSIIGSTYFTIAVAGYWAFGYAQDPSGFLPNSFTVPPSSHGAIVLVNLFAIIQIAGCFQIYCRPTYEWASLILEDSNQGPYARRNVIARFAITLTYSCLMTLVSCAIPFFGSFVALVGAIGFTPLDFIVPLLLWNQVNWSKAHWAHKGLNYFFAICYVTIACVGFIGAVWLINLNVQTYSFFANL